MHASGARARCDAPRRPAAARARGRARRRELVQYPKGSALFINVGVNETRDST
jgi:hypothetical protein